MQVQIQAAFQLDPALQQLIDEKLQKLSNYFNRIIDVTVFLFEEEDRHKNGDGKIVELKMQVPGQTLFASGQGDMYEKSLAFASEKLKKQLVRYKEQLVSHS